MAKRWTREDDEFLAAYYGIPSTEWLAKQDLKRTPNAVYQRVAYLKRVGRWRDEGCEQSQNIA